VTNIYVNFKSYSLAVRKVQYPFLWKVKWRHYYLLL